MAVASFSRIVRPATLQKIVQEWVELEEHDRVQERTTQYYRVPVRSLNARVSILAVLFTL